MTRSPVRSWAALVAGQLLAGVLIGVIWLFIAPRSRSYVIAGPGNKPFIIPAESEALVAGDGRYFVLCFVAGLAGGVAAWYLIRRFRGWQTLLVLVFGAVASALVARWIGETFSSGQNSGPLQTAITPTLALHGAAFLLAEAFAAVLVYTALAGFSSDSDFIAPPAQRVDDGTSDSGSEDNAPATAPITR
jgi:hypothetical protein